MLLSVLFLREVTNKKTIRVLLGIIFAITNTVMLGFYLIIIRKVAVKYSPVTLQKWMFLFAALFVIPFCINDLQMQSFNPSAFRLQPLFQLGFVLLFATVLNNLLYPVALKRIQPTIASIYINLQPIIVSIVVILIGQDIFSWNAPIAAIRCFADQSFTKQEAKLICCSIFIRRTSCHFLEPTAEMLWILKT